MFPKCTFYLKKSNVFTQGFQSYVLCPLRIFLKKCLQLLEKQSFPVKIKIIINEYFDVCFNDEKFKRVSLG